jgi:hypothetical protein
VSKINLDELFDRAVTVASEYGTVDGQRAGYWFEIPDKDDAMRLLAAINSGDKAVLCELPMADLSGQFVDTIEGPGLFALACSKVGLDSNNEDNWDALFSDVCDAYEEAYDIAALNEILARASDTVEAK